MYVLARVTAGVGRNIAFRNRIQENTFSTKLEQQEVEN